MVLKYLLPGLTHTQRDARSGHASVISQPWLAAYSTHCRTVQPHAAFLTHRASRRVSIIVVGPALLCGPGAELRIAISVRLSVRWLPLSGQRKTLVQ